MWSRDIELQPQGTVAPAFATCISHRLPASQPSSSPPNKIAAFFKIEVPQCRHQIPWAEERRHRLGLVCVCLVYVDKSCGPSPGLGCFKWYSLASDQFEAETIDQQSDQEWPLTWASWLANMSGTPAYLSSDSLSSSGHSSCLSRLTTETGRRNASRRRCTREPIASWVINTHSIKVEQAGRHRESSRHKRDRRRPTTQATANAGQC